MKVLDLFSGIGGFSLAAEWMGWETVAFVERDTFCQKVLRKNFGQDIDIYNDITTFSGKPFRGQVGIVTGGFPCQPYSQAGLRKGTDDDRHLWPEMLRVIREVQPRFVVGENVLGLLNWNGGLVFDAVQSDLEIEGYEVIPFLLPACAVNSPQLRNRIWFIAYNDKVEQESVGIGRTENKQQRETQIGREDWKLFDLVGDGTVFANWRNTRRTDHTESVFCRNGDGVSGWMDRLDALGNAVVPQIAYEIFRAIEATDAPN